MPIGAGHLTLAMMLFNRLIRGLLLQMNRDPINVDSDGLHCEALEAHERKDDKDKDTQMDPPILLQELQ